jgi:deoxyribose-phosphate aldolase
VEAAIADHADELDIVINLSHLKSGHWKALEAEMTTLLEVARINATIVKVIIESGILTEDEIIGCCRLYGDFGVDFVKTSTGYAERGATLEAVQLMRKHLPSDVRIKASGGIKTYGDAKMYIEAGAARIGCSAGVAIMKQQTSLQ